MSESATPEGAPDSTAPIGERVDHIMGLLNVPEKKDEPKGESEESPEQEADNPEGDPAESEGQESEEAPEPEQEVETPQTYRVKVDGEEVEVTLDELLKGYSRTEDYKRKTARVADDRRELERQVAEIQQARMRAVQEYQNIVANASQDAAILARWNATDRVKLARENPGEYNTLREQAEQASYRIALAQQQAQHEQMRSLHERQSRSHEELTGKLPEWGDDAKRPELQRKLFDSLSSYGYTPQELSQIVDYRTILVAHDAMMYRLSQQAQAQAKKTLQAKQVQQPPKTANPTKRVASETEDSERLKLMRKRANQSNRIHDRIDYVMAKLGAS